MFVKLENKVQILFTNQSSWILSLMLVSVLCTKKGHSKLVVDLCLNLLFGLQIIGGMASDYLWVVSHFGKITLAKLEIVDS